MKCAKCQADNGEAARYCEECGARLEVACSKCGQPLTPGKKFCRACGSPAGSAETDRSPPPPATSPASHTPAHLEEKSLASGSAVEGERKQVTVLFADVSGYTAMNEKLDPEEVREVMGRIFGLASQVISRYGGVIEKYIGDAVMAVFGLSHAHEDDAVRAVRAAREMSQFVADLSPHFRERLGRELAMHTGINTGLVVTGRTAGEAEGAMGVVGDAVNVAARLSDLAGSGEILVGAKTQALIDRYFDTSALEPTQVSGKAEPIGVFRVVGARERPTATRHFAGLIAELVGREVELALLKQTTQRLRDGKGSIVALRGEAGTGKSRLLEQLRAGLPETFRWRSGIAYDHTRDIPYAPVIDMLAGAWGIQERDTPVQVREKLEAGAREVLAEPDAHIPYLGALFSLEYAEAANVSPEYRKDRIHAGLLALFEGMARRGPTIFHLEDLHWADPSTVELLRHVLTRFQQAAITVATYRPPFSLFPGDALGEVRAYREIELETLSPTLVDDMVRALLQGAEPPRELLQFVRDRAGGNPLFIEEMVTSLMQTRALVQNNGAWELAGSLDAFNVPDTVQGVIASRLDRLDADDKHLLQEASVIGSSFFYAVLGRITTLSGDIHPRLDGLEHENMIRAQVLEPDLEYMFKHPLTQEVVYRSLLNKNRESIHERVGQAMEEVLAERLPEYYERLAFHFLQGSSRLKAVDYLIKAGTKAVARFALDQADSYYRQAYQRLTAGGVRSEQETALLFDLLDWWGKVFYYFGDFRDLLALLRPHHSEAVTLTDRSRRGMFHAWQGIALFFVDDLKASEDSLRLALALGEEAHDERVIAYACTWLSCACAHLSRYNEGIACGERAHEIAARMPEDDYLYFKSLAMVGENLAWMGEAAKCREVGERLVDYGQRHGNPRSLLMGYWTIVYGNNNAGDYPAALAAAERAMQVSQDPLYLQLARLSYCVSHVRNFRAESTFEEVVGGFRSRGTQLMVNILGGVLGSNRFLEGRMAAGMKTIDEASRNSLANGNQFSYVLAEGVRGKVYLNMMIGKRPPARVMLKNLGFLLRHLPFAARRAEAFLGQAADFYGQVGATGYRAQALLDLGLLHRHKKHRERAKQCLAEAEGLFEAVGAHAYLRQTREALAQLEGGA